MIANSCYNITWHYRGFRKEDADYWILGLNTLPALRSVARAAHLYREAENEDGNTRETALQLDLALDELEKLGNEK